MRVPKRLLRKITLGTALLAAPLAFSPTAGIVANDACGQSDGTCVSSPASVCCVVTCEEGYEWVDPAAR